MQKRYDKYSQGDIHWQWYHNLPSYYQLVNESIAPFKNIPIGTVVDVGCGDGLPLSFLDQLGFKCYGVEPEMDGINLAVAHNVTAEFFVERAEEFANRDLGFDYLFCLDTIEHLEHPEVMVKIMKRIRKFGIIITDWAGTHEEKDSSRYHNIEFTPETFAELFRGFRLDRIQISNPKYFGYMIRNVEE